MNEGGENLSWYVESNPSELYHYGVKGMKWGKHLRSKLGLDARNEYLKKKEQVTADSKRNSVSGYLYNKSKKSIDTIRNTEKVIPGYYDRADYLKKDKEYEIDKYINLKREINKNKVEASKAYKKYSSTPIGKLETMTSDVVNKVSSFINGIIKKKTNGPSWKDKTTNSVKREAYVLSQKDTKKSQIDTNKNWKSKVKSDIQKHKQGK